MAVENTEEIFYVRMTNGKEIRKTLVEMSKEMIIVLQRYDKFRGIREEKLKLMEGLTKEFSTLQDMSQKLEAHLPKVNIRIKEVEEKKADLREKGGVAKAKQEHTSLSDEEEIKRLEAAISEIEDKLSRMG